MHFYRNRRLATIIYYVTAVIILLDVCNVCGLEEEQQAISINKPIVRRRQDDSTWVHFSIDYVRCFCNLPACVSTGYMCKSSGGVCFSDLLGHSISGSSSYRGRHGCLELLTDKEKKYCEPSEVAEEEVTTNEKPPSVTSRKHAKSLFLCCRHDMCNHVDNPQTKNLINNTLLGELLEDNESRRKEKPEQYPYSNSEVWFRAATIAVPICGAIILFVLIALAVKILRSENQNANNHKLAMYIHQMPSQSKSRSSTDKFHRQPCHFDNYLRNQHHNQNFYTNNSSVSELQRQVHVPLLFNDEKNDRNAKLNLIQHSNECSATTDDFLISSNSAGGHNVILDLEKCDQNIVKNIKRDDACKFPTEKS